MIWISGVGHGIGDELVGVAGQVGPVLRGTGAGIVALLLCLLAAVLVVAAIAVAACRGGRIARAFAVGVAIGGVAGRIEVRRIARIGHRRIRIDARRDARRHTVDADDRIGARGDIGIDPRRHIRGDGGNACVDVEIGRAHDALRMRQVERGKRHGGRDQRECSVARPGPAFGIVNHETSAPSGIGVAARLTAQLPRG